MIKLAAIKLENGTVLTGLRHDRIFRKAKEDGLNRLEVIRGEQGFVDDKGNFLNRQDAAKHALECKQVEIGKAVVRHEFNGRDLYSEDLY